MSRSVSYGEWSDEVAQQLGVLVQDHFSRSKAMFNKEPWVSLCVSKAHYHRLRRGVASNLQLTTLLTLCDRLGVRPQKLIDEALRAVRAQHEEEEE